MPSIELIIDIVLVMLLGGVIISAWILNNRLDIVRQGQTEMADLVQQLNIATSNAQSSVATLKGVGVEAQDVLTLEIKKARALADELTLITEAGDSLANRIEKNLTSSAKAAKANKKAKKSKDIDIKDADPADILDDIKGKASKSELEEADHDLLEALKQAR
jgi:hypothetical protein